MFTWCSQFTDSSNEKVDVVHTIIDELETFDDLDGYKVDQVVDVLHPLQSTQLTECIVACVVCTN